ncbi:MULTISPECIES: hypothetical protein [unclassified Vibrio]|uniref:hypothetical protein n=1 Tax=unclassified Vibrio TaxID=2614977 RepID=UPI0021D3B66A|nr:MULTISPECIES: hypothetical protein [unclassified Vibrio]MDW1675082.1 hypothetical protein [Vibrio sp. Vb2610]MDW1807226.1 hypothetical protein [Vibrio sp. Vb2628]
MVQWIMDNKEWFLSGAGVAMATFVASLLLKKRKDKITNQTQIGGDSSSNYQSARDINISVKENDER